MYRITVTVTPERDLAAHLRLTQGSLTVYDDWACASADPKCGARLGNKSLDPMRPGGHPPLGHYDLVARGKPPQGTENEYGRQLLLFEPVRGPALDAEAYGRLALLVYSGRMAPDSKLRRTQGGLRLSSTAMDRLLVGLGEDTPVELRIEIAEPPPWWAFWRKVRVHPPLSGRPPEFAEPPNDEATLMAELMKNQRKRHMPLQRTDDDEERERRRDRDERRDTRSSSDDTPEYRGRGGEGGGAGASGGWSDAPAAGRGPGVDAAGRVIATAGIAAVAAAAVMATRDEAQAANAPPSSSTESDTTLTSTDSTSAESTSTGSESSWSSSSTSY